MTPMNLPIKYLCYLTDLVNFLCTVRNIKKDILEKNTDYIIILSM